MAVLANNNPTLMDLAKASDPGGKVEMVVEILKQTNEMLDDMTFMEGNLPTGHRTTLRSGIPEGTWRRLYQGVQPTKGETVQVTETCGMLEAYAEVDKALADLNGNAAAFRLMEDRAHMEGMNQQMAKAVIFGNEATNPERFTGFAPRYNSKSADNAENLFDAGGTGADNTSIWLVTWSPMTCHGIIPKGSSAGLQINDKGQVTIEDVDGNGGRMEAYRTHYRWDAGLCLKDWRYVCRIANIDKSNLNGTATGNSADLPDLMFRAMEMIPDMNMGRGVFYMSRQVRTALRQQVTNKVSNSTLQIEDVGGKKIMMFQGIPVRRVDALASDEARVV